jgi:hypothetical protein
MSCCWPCCFSSSLRRDALQVKSVKAVRLKLALARASAFLSMRTRH